MFSEASPSGYEVEGQDEVVSISRGELEALRELASRAASPGAASREEDHLRESAEKDRRVADLEKSYKAAVRDRELATALAGRSLVPGAASQLIKLWRDEFDVYESEGEYRVSARDGRTLGKAVAEKLAESEYSHFCLPSSRGGAAPQGPSRASGPTAPAAPRNLGEAALQQWREAATGRSGSGPGPIGLRRR